MRYNLCTLFNLCALFCLILPLTVPFWIGLGWLPVGVVLSGTFVAAIACSVFLIVGDRATMWWPTGEVEQRQANQPARGWPS